MTADMLAAFGPTASVAAAFIAVVLTVAAVAKIRRPATPELRRLGLPAPRFLAAALPAAELGVASLIVVRPRLGAAAALVLLAAFTQVLVRAVLDGVDVSCGCFGSADNRPVTWATVARNGVLLIVAALGLLGADWSAPELSAVAVVAGVVLVGGVAVQMFDLRLSMGRLWSVQLAGEARTTSTRRNAS